MTKCDVNENAADLMWIIYCLGEMLCANLNCDFSFVEKDWVILDWDLNYDFGTWKDLKVFPPGHFLYSLKSSFIHSTSCSYCSVQN